MRRANDVSEDELSVAKFLELRKVYTRVRKLALWGSLVKYDMNWKCVESLLGLDENT